MYWYVQSVAGKWREDILVTLNVGSDAGCAEFVYGGTQAYKH
jgi:hypothetical protein